MAIYLNHDYILIKNENNFYTSIDIFLNLFRF